MPEFRPFHPFLPAQEALPELYSEGGITNNGRDQHLPDIRKLLEALEPDLNLSKRREACIDALRLWESWTQTARYTRCSTPAFLLYRVRYRDRWQHGWIGLTDAHDLIRNRIRKHEHVRADRVAQVSEFVTATNLQTTPVFLSHPQHPVLSRLIFEVQSNAPERCGKLPDGREFSLWIVDEARRISEIVEAVASLSCLYIADGHHRAAVAEAQAFSRQNQDFAPMLSVLVSSNELHIFPFYRRILNDEGPLSLWSFIDKLRVNFILRPCLIEQMYFQYIPHGQYLLCTAEACWQLIRKEPLKKSSKGLTSDHPEDLLDVGILHSEIIGPLVGINDPTQDPRIEYGPLSIHINDFKSMLRDPRTAFVLIARAPTTDDIFRVANSGGVMPPKSTSVEPKIINGLVMFLTE
jgi:uncharacterized protein (DUF1015 family)